MFRIFYYANSETMIKSIGRRRRHCFFFFNLTLSSVVFLYMILTKPTLRAFIDPNHPLHFTLRYCLLYADYVVPLADARLTQYPITPKYY